MYESSRVRHGARVLLTKHPPFRAQLRRRIKVGLGPTFIVHQLSPGTCSVIVRGHVGIVVPIPRMIMTKHAHIFREVNIRHGHIPLEEEHILVIFSERGFGKVGTAGDDEGILR